MQSCIFPLELCEAIIDAVPSGVLGSWPLHCKDKSEWTAPYDIHLHEQSTLRACSLTCHAWRRRSQALLWKQPTLIFPVHVSRFYKAICDNPLSPRHQLTSEMYMVTYDSDAPASISLRANYAMDLLPNLRVLHTRHVNWIQYAPYRSGDGIPVHLLRAHPPFFANLTQLECIGCVFADERYLLDVIWACRNLVEFKMSHTNFMSRVCEDVGAAQRLSLLRDSRTTRCMPQVTLRIDL
ncbi:hypothetical protein FKP32DRAFT_1219633 [Trametes sanguinea]|nr:hypothetical protein FKP32DRAFT_1219633 [Trametes sanguinea]